MAVKIRLTRLGRKNIPGYRLVVAQELRKRDGRVIETVGTYNPKKAENAGGFVFKRDRVEYWVAKGAQPTTTVARLLKRAKKNLTPVSA